MLLISSLFLCVFSELTDTERCCNTTSNLGGSVEQCSKQTKPEQQNRMKTNFRNYVTLRELAEEKWPNLEWVVRNYKHDMMLACLGTETDD